MLPNLKRMEFAQLVTGGVSWWSVYTKGVSQAQYGKGLVTAAREGGGVSRSLSAEKLWDSLGTLKRNSGQSGNAWQQNLNLNKGMRACEA